MELLIPLICGILYRLDGWGKGDSFLPCWPFTRPSWRIGGINYARYAIGPVIALITLNWAYILTYSIAVSIPYGENGWFERIFGPVKWLLMGIAFGMASLSYANAVWLGLIAFGAKFFDVDHAWWEFGMGFLGTIYFVFK